MKVAAFDIGIRNLAWCLLDLSGSDIRQILSWDNYDLLAQSSRAAPAAAKPKCSQCSAKPIFSYPSGVCCARHIPKEYPALKDLSGVALRTLPPLKTLKTLVPPALSRLSRATMLIELAKQASVPIVPTKAKKATQTDLSELHDAIRAFVISNAAALRQADQILLENQPVLKNPTMKTVQILLFATLRDILQPNPPTLGLIHAGKKVKGAATGDAGYKDRKAGSEARVQAYFTGHAFANQAHWKKIYESHSKKSDLADAFCMCLDSA
jgi:hypothetical protein